MLPTKEAAAAGATRGRLKSRKLVQIAMNLFKRFFVGKRGLNGQIKRTRKSNEVNEKKG